MVRQNTAPRGAFSFGSARVLASLTTALTGANNDLTFTSDIEGQPDLRIRYVDPGAPSQALAVSVEGNRSITVSLATSAGSAITSTAAQVRDAVNGHAGAGALVTAANAAGNDGTGVVTAMGWQPLTGGY